ncbi:MAG: hypothetical protein AAF384_18300, partial [Pseudomonadota bacterium]
LGYGEEEVTGPCSGSGVRREGPRKGAGLRAEEETGPFEHGVRASVNLIDRLFNVEDPGGLDDFTTALNPDSLEIIGDAVIEPALNTSDAQVFQFERLGYFAKDTESTRENPIFNRTATLRDTWAKLAQS